MKIAYPLYFYKQLLLFRNQKDSKKQAYLQCTGHVHRHSYKQRRLLYREALLKTPDRSKILR